MTLMLTIVTGTLAGAFHVLSGPDHLAAVAPLAVGTRRSWVAGWTWGLGHASGVVVVAAIAVLLRESLPPIQMISAWGERLVGGALIALGLWGLRKSARLRSRAHTHSGVVHDHLHIDGGPEWIRKRAHAHASFWLGILHGIAGSSHFLGVVPALALPTTSASMIYIGAFGIGTIGAMTSFAATVGCVSGTHRMRHALTPISAVSAIGVGGIWLVGGF